MPAAYYVLDVNATRENNLRKLEELIGHIEFRCENAVKTLRRQVASIRAGTPIVSTRHDFDGDRTDLEETALDVALATVFQAQLHNSIAILNTMATTSEDYINGFVKETSQRMDILKTELAAYRRQRGMARSRRGVLAAQSGSPAGLKKVPAASANNRFLNVAKFRQI